MAIKLRLTGRDSFISALTYGVSVLKNKVILVRDADGAYLQALVNRDADPDVNVFTVLVGAETVDHDFTTATAPDYYGDGSIVVHPGKLASLPYRIARGVLLRDQDDMPYGYSDGVGGYLPVQQPYNVDSLSNLVANAAQQVLTAAGTYTITPPKGATILMLSLFGGGAGGGSGRRGAAASARSGGCGGSNGSGVRIWIPKEDWTGVLSLTVGAGGAGGAAVAVNDTNGNNGSTGATSFLQISGSTYVRASGGNYGAGGTNANTTSPGTNTADIPTQVSSSTNVAAAMTDQFLNGTSLPGCCGGSISAADAVLGFQKTGSNPLTSLAGMPTASGAAGIGARRGSLFASVGGNGGAASITANADAGGAGIYGSGGGGGGASLNGFNSGAGGRGGDGYAILIWR